MTRHRESQNSSRVYQEEFPMNLKSTVAGIPSGSVQPNRLNKELYRFVDL